MKKIILKKMMRPKWKEVILTIMMLLSLNLSAQDRGGQGSGNGGDAVVCFVSVPIANQVKQIIDENESQPLSRKKDPLGNILDKEILSVDFLDLYDLKNSDSPFNQDGPLLINLEGKNLSESVSYLLDELSKRTQVGDELIKIKEEILINESWIKSSSVLEISDSAYSGILPDNCLLLQLGYQFNESGNYKIYYNFRLFNKMNLIDQTAFVIHEYFFHFVKYKNKLLDAVDARLVRKFIQKVFQKSFYFLSPVQIARYFHENYWNGNISRFSLGAKGAVNILGQKINFDKVLASGKNKNTGFYEFELEVNSKDNSSFEFEFENHYFNLIPQKATISIDDVENKTYLTKILVAPGSYGAIYNFFGRKQKILLTNSSIYFTNNKVKSIDFESIEVPELADTSIYKFIQNITNHEVRNEVNEIIYFENTNQMQLVIKKSNYEQLKFWFSNGSRESVEVNVDDLFYFNKFSRETRSSDGSYFHISGNDVQLFSQNGFYVSNNADVRGLGYLPVNDLKCGSNIIFNIDGNVKSCFLTSDGYIKKKLIKAGTKVCFNKLKTYECN